MSSKITETFKTISKTKNGAFIRYFILGYPDIDTSYKLIKEASKYADIIELGIPFSDPVADGPTIQFGVTSVLKQNIPLKKLFDITKKLCSEVKKPFVYMIYFNQIYNYGISNFINKMKEIGVSGIIVPDLLPDSEPEFNQIAKENEIDLIFLLTPTTSKNRIPLIIKESSGFLYFVSVIGITGERKSVNDTIKPLIENIKAKTDLPICVGFGISNPDHVKSITQFSDGVIVGSAIVKKITENIGKENLIPTVVQMIKELDFALIREEKE